MRRDVTYRPASRSKVKNKRGDRKFFTNTAKRSRVENSPKLIYRGGTRL